MALDSVCNFAYGEYDGYTELEYQNSYIDFSLCISVVLCIYFVFILVGEEIGVWEDKYR